MQCQYYKIRDMEWGSFAEERAHRLPVQTGCGHPNVGHASASWRTSTASPPVVRRRAAYNYLRLLLTRVRGRGVGGQIRRRHRPVTCFVTRKGFAAPGVSRALPTPPSISPENAAPGPRGYPMITHLGRNHLGEPRRQPQHLRRGRFKRSALPRPPGRDAHRLFGRGVESTPTRAVR